MRNTDLTEGLKHMQNKLYLEVAQSSVQARNGGKELKQACKRTAPTSLAIQINWKIRQHSIFPHRA
jgi:hypothetical protein